MSRMSEWSVDRIDIKKHFEPGNCRWARGSERLPWQRMRKLLANYTDDQLFGIVDSRKGHGTQAVEYLEPFTNEDIWKEWCRRHPVT